MLERAVGGEEEPEPQRGRGGGHQQHGEDHDCLHLAPGQPARHSPDYRPHGHRRAPTVASLAIWPSATWIVRVAYRAARSGLWVTSTSVWPDRLRSSRRWCSSPTTPT